MCAPSTASLADADQLARAHQVDFLAIMDGKRVIGLCSARQIQNLLRTPNHRALHAERLLRDYRIKTR